MNAKATLLLLALAAVAAMPSCADSSPTVAAGAQAVGCLQPEDCDEGRVCVKKTLKAEGGICHLGCLDTSGCAKGERCVSSLIGPVCLPVAETECTYDSDCFVPLVCGPDQRCRDSCKQDYDCIKPQKCTNEHVCAEPNEVGPGNELIIVPLHANGDGGTDAGGSGGLGSNSNGNGGAPLSSGGDNSGAAGVAVAGNGNAGDGSAGEGGGTADGGAGPDVSVAGSGTTVDASCRNGKKDGTETAKDCGGTICPKCAAESACVYHTDCASGACEGGTCKPKYTLSVELSQNFTGRVRSTPSGIDCGETCSASYAAGKVVQLEAAPSLGASFTGWSGAGCSGTGVCVVTMSKAQSVTATFGPGPKNPYVWAKSIATADVRAVAIDPDGNALLAGSLVQFDFGGGPLSGPVAIAKYSPIGGYLWARHIVGDDIDATVTNLSADGNGDVVVAGHVLYHWNGTQAATVDFGDGIPKGCRGGYFAKYGAAKGALQWARCFNQVSAGILVTSVIGVRFAPNGDVVVVGWAGSETFGQQTVQGTFVARYSGASGEFLSVASVTGNMTPTAVAVDLNGNVFVGGFFDHVVDFGTFKLESSSFSTDGFLAKFSPAGVALWAKRFGDGQEDQVTSLATDKNGSVIFGGYFSGQFDPGDGPINTAGSRDILVGKYDADGRYQWAKRYGGPGDDSPDSSGVRVETLPSGDVLITGTITERVDFGGGSLPSGDSIGAKNVFVAKVSRAAGTYLWSQAYVGPEVRTVAVAAAGEALLGGQFTGSVDFGGGALTVGGFVLKLTP